MCNETSELNTQLSGWSQRIKKNIRFNDAILNLQLTVNNIIKLNTQIHYARKFQM